MGVHVADETEMAQEESSRQTLTINTPPAIDTATDYRH
jgi:hypothetical protein